MISVFVNRPATTVMFVMFFVLLGFVSFFTLNVEQQPRIEFPLVIVNVTYPGASPEEVETQVLTKVEDAVAEISDMKKIEGRAFENFGYVLLEFNLSADVNLKSIEVKDKVEAILNELPDSMERPIIQKVDPFSQSVVDLVLLSTSHNSAELFEFADKNLRNAFSRITGVGEVELFGGRERQIKVELLPDLMRQRYIGIDEVLNQLRARNLTIPAGNIDQSGKSLSVRYQGEFASLEEIKDLRLTTAEGGQFTLSQIARVYDGAEDVTTLARFDGNAVLTLSVKKISDGNDIKVSQGIMALLPELRQTLPKGMALEVALDRSKNVVRETEGALQSIALGLLLTVLILLFFTGNWRTTVIAGVVIPSSIISSLFLVEKSGFTINFITLLALATSLGTLIANSIVVIESILSRLEKGEDGVSAAINGTKDAVIPVLAACGTNLVVFTPIAFMGGIVGQFMLQFGMTVVYTTLFSLMASFTLTPMMAGLLLSPRDLASKNRLARFSSHVTDFLLKEYKLVFDALFRIPMLSLVVLAAIFFGSFSVIPYIGNEFIPTSDRDIIDVVFSLPQGTNIEDTLKAVKVVEARLTDLPEVVSLLTIVGNNGEENATVTANLKPSADRERSDVEIIKEITPSLALLPDAEVEVRRGQSGPGNADISLNVAGQDYDKMIEISRQITSKMQDTGYFRSVTSSYKTPKMEARFYPNQAQLERFGVSNAQVGSIVRSAVYGDDTSKFRENGEQYDIVVELDDRFKGSLQDIQDIFVVAKTGLVPLGSLGEFRVVASTPTILRRDRDRVIQINGYLAKSTAGVVQGELDGILGAMELPQGYRYQFVGNSENQAESGREIGKAFLLAVILTYMILAAIMNSFVHPFTISTSILTSYSGVFLSLFFVDSSINIASMLGIVMMVGLAVNNAILVLEETERLLREDKKLDIKDALWLATHAKFRAVLMTSIAIVFGVLPQMWSPDLAKASMGTVIVGGVTASIFFTFLMTPLTYYYFEKLRRFVTRRESRARRKSAATTERRTKAVLAPSS